MANNQNSTMAASEQMNNEVVTLNHNEENLMTNTDYNTTDKSSIPAATAYNYTFTKVMLPNGKEAFDTGLSPMEIEIEMQRLNDAKSLSSLRDVHVFATFMEMMLKETPENLTEYIKQLMEKKHRVLTLMKQGEELCRKASKEATAYADVWESFGVNFTLFKNAVSMLSANKYKPHRHNLRVLGSNGTHICYAIEDIKKNVACILMITA